MVESNIRLDVKMEEEFNSTTNTRTTTNNYYENFSHANSSLGGDNPGSLFQFSLTVTILILVGYYIIVLVTICGNVLVLCAFRVERKLHKPSNYFLFSLACADLIIGFFSMPLYSVYVVTGYWPLGTFLCDFWLALDYSCCTVSVMNLILISADRLYSVSWPASYRNKMTLRRATIMIIPTWIFPVLLYFTAVMGWPLFVPTYDREARDPRSCEVPFINDPVFMAVSTVFVFWLPLSVLFIIYFQIFMVIRKLANKRKQKSVFRETVKSRTSETKLASPSKQISAASSTESEESQQIRANNHKNSSISYNAIGHNENGNMSSSKGDTSEKSLLSVQKSSISNSTSINSDKNSSLPRKSCYGDIESEFEPSETSSSDRRLTMDGTSFTNLRTSTGELSDMQKDISTTSIVSKGKKLSISDTVKKYRRQRNGRRRSLRDRAAERPDKKAIKTLTLILGAFFLTWSPYSTFFIILGWCPHCIDPTLYGFSYWLCYLNSTINPICYALANDLFRVTFIKLLSGKYIKFRF